MSVGVRAAQSTVKNGWSRRRTSEWIARAVSSLPVPDLGAELEVVAAHPRIGEHQVIARRGADRDRVGPGDVGPPNIGPGDHLWLGPMSYRRDITEEHPPARTWYDDLIISREEIPDPR